MGLLLIKAVEMMLFYIGADTFMYGPKAKPSEM